MPPRPVRRSVKVPRHPVEQLTPTRTFPDDEARTSFLLIVAWHDPPSTGGAAPFARLSL